MRLLQFGMLSVVSLMGDTVFYCGHVTRLIANLRQAIRLLLQKRSKIALSRWRTYQTFDEFLRDHGKIQHFARATNQELYSKIMFVFLTINVPANVFIVYRLDTVASKSLVEYLIFLLVLAIQFVVFLLATVPSAYFTAKMHSPRRLIPALQGHLR